MTDSKVTKNQADGVFMDSCCNLVERSAVSRNGGRGVVLTGGDNQVTACKVDKNTGAGIVLDDIEGNIVANTRAKGNGAEGVSILCPGSVLNLKAKKNAAHKRGLNRSRARRAKRGAKKK